MKKASKDEIAEGRKKLLSTTRDYTTREFSVDTLYRYRRDKNLVLVDNPIKVLFTTRTSSKHYGGPKLVERILLGDFIPTMTFERVNDVGEVFYSENCGLEVGFLLDYIYCEKVMKKTIRFTELQGTTFSDLPSHLQRKLLKASFRSVVFHPIPEPEERTKLYKVTAEFTTDTKPDLDLLQKSINWDNLRAVDVTVRKD